MSSFSRSGVVLLYVVFASAGVAQDSVQDGKPDPYKTILDRLVALVQQALPEWRYHSDVPHPEDSQLNVSDWGTLSVKPSIEPDPSPHWKGARVLRRWVEIPEKIDGYATRGSRVKLELAFTSQDSITITFLRTVQLFFMAMRICNNRCC